MFAWAMMIIVGSLQVTAMEPPDAATGARQAALEETGLVEVPVTGLVAAELVDEDFIDAPFEDFHVSLVRGRAGDFELSDGQTSWAISVLHNNAGEFEPLEGTLAFASEDYRSALARAESGDPDASLVPMEEGPDAVAIVVAPGVVALWEPSGEVTLLAGPGVGGSCREIGDSRRICVTRAVRADGSWKARVYVFEKRDGRWVLVLRWSTEWHARPTPATPGKGHGSDGAPAASPSTEANLARIAAMLEEWVPLSEEERQALLAEILAAMLRVEELQRSEGAPAESVP